MLTKAITTVLLFMLFYSPPILGMRCLRILMILSFGYIMINIRSIYNRVIRSRLIYNYLIWSAIILYIILVGCINDNGMNYIAGQVYWLISVIPTAIVICNISQKSGGGIIGLIDCSIMAGLLQSIISIIAFVSPTIKQALITSMIQGHVFEEDAYTYEVILRLYGYSGGLTFGMPVLQSFLGMLAVYMAVNWKKKYILAVPFLLFSAIVNARTSFVVILVCGLIIIFQRNKNNVKKAFRIAFLILLSIGAFIILIPVVKEIAPQTFNWLSNGMDELMLMAKGRVDQGYFSYLTNGKKWIFPTGFGALFGYGIRVMGNNQYGSATDIGIVNDMWYGGILYVLIVYTLFYLYCKKLRRIGDSVRMPNEEKGVEGLGKYLFSSFLALGIILNLKTFIIDIHCLSMFFILLLVYSDVYYRKQGIRHVPLIRKKRIRIALGGINGRLSN